MEKSEFIKRIKNEGVTTILKETTKNCYPGRLYAANRVGLIGYWAEGCGYIIFKMPMKRFSTSGRTFEKIKVKDF